MSLADIFTTKVRAFANKKGGTPVDVPPRIINMLSIVENEPESNSEAAFTDKELKTAREWFQRKLARAETSGTPFAEIVTIDAPTAYFLLQRNPPEENRKLSQVTVNKYASDMVSGRWRGLNGQTIVISNDGYLNDGQHRLNAVIQAEARIPFTIVFGAERESRMTLDQNKVRTSGDYVGMAGMKNGNKVAAVASILYAFDNGVMRKSIGQVFHTENRPTKAALHAYAVERADKIGNAIHAVDSTGARVLTSDTRLAAAVYLIGETAGWDDAIAFMSRVIEGDNLGKTDPAFVARGRLLSERAAGSSSPLRSLEILFRGWNAHRRGQRLHKIVCNNTLPEIEA